VASFIVKPSNRPFLRSNRPFLQVGQSMYSSQQAGGPAGGPGQPGSGSAGGSSSSGKGDDEGPVIDADFTDTSR
jgi:hypothetical protein